MIRANMTALRTSVRDGFRSIAVQARQAQRLSINSDNLCDLLDDIDNELQAVIELVKLARGKAPGGAS
jgi:hypothetical protein